MSGKVTRSSQSAAAERRARISANFGYRDSCASLAGPSRRPGVLAVYDLNGSRATY